MKSILKFLLIFFIILASAVILTPLLFQFLPFKFERIFNRIVMIGTLGAILLFVRIRKPTLERYGIIWKGKTSFSLFLFGFLSGVLTLGALSVIKVILGLGVWDIDLGTWVSFLQQVFAVLFAAVLIGVIEEFFFRGFIYDSLRQGRISVIPALLITNVFYSLLHFISEKKPFVDDTPTVVDSLKLLAAPLMSLADFPSFWNEALGLFIFGIVLNLLVLRTGSLYPSIGLHAGCVLFIKLDGFFVDFSNHNHLLFSGAKMYDGGLGWLVLLGLGVALPKLLSSCRVKEIVP